MTDTKMTRKDVLNRIKELVSEDEIEVHEFCDKMIASLNKPRPHKTKPETVEFREDVDAFLNAIEDGAGATVADVAAAFDVSIQKASAALRHLVKVGDATMTEDGKTKVYYAA